MNLKMVKMINLCYIYFTTIKKKRHKFPETLSQILHFLNVLFLFGKLILGTYYVLSTVLGLGYIAMG